MFMSFDNIVMFVVGCVDGVFMMIMLYLFCYVVINGLSCFVLNRCCYGLICFLVGSILKFLWMWMIVFLSFSELVMIFDSFFWYFIVMC